MGFPAGTHLNSLFFADVLVPDVWMLLDIGPQ